MVSGLKQQGLAAGDGFGDGQAAPAFEQGHLGGKVTALADFNHRCAGIALEGPKADEITAAIAAGPNEPEGVGHGWNRPEEA